MNLYTYCENNPIFGIDPSGHFKLPNWVKKAAGAVKDFASSTVGKVVIGTVATVAAVGITVATGGAALPLLVGVAASTGIGAGISAVDHRIQTGSWNGAGKAALEGAADGFMWGGIGAFASAGTSAVKSIATMKKGFSTGKAGEEYLAKLVGGKSQKYFQTSRGGRFIDQFSKGVAHESKVGYTSLSSRVKTQVLKDAELLKNGQINKSVWHFYKSSVTGKIGPTKPLKNFLSNNKIKYKIHRFW